MPPGKITGGYGRSPGSRRADRRAGPLRWSPSLTPRCVVLAVLIGAGALAGAASGRGTPDRSPRRRPRATKPADPQDADPVPEEAQAGDGRLLEAALRPVQVAAEQSEGDRHPLRAGGQHRRDLQHLQDRPARRRVPRAAQRLLALRGRRFRRRLQIRPADDPLPPRRRAQLDRDRGRARRLLRPGHPQPARPAQRLAALRPVASLPLRHLGLERDRPQREPLLALLQGARSPLPRARPTATGTTPTCRSTAPT